MTSRGAATRSDDSLFPSEAPQGELPAVWIIDDSALQAEASRLALSNRFDVTVYSSGAQALEALAISPPPSVVVLDWHMPDLSGDEVCRFIRSSRDLAQLPILVLTASGAEALNGALIAGANDFVQKPFATAELVNRVNNLAQVSGMHRKLALARTALREEAAFRDKFLGILAHDLRQPLNTICMAAQLLQATPTPAQLLSLPAMQLRASQRMQRMIRELLDFTRQRPETGVAIVRERQALGDIVARSVQELELTHADRSLRLQVAGDTNGLWDADRLAQVCSNLIGNALEHGNSAPVDVTVTGEADHVEIRVTNQGDPLTEEVARSLFEPFRQGPRAASKNTGVGLGLHIASSIVASHRGQLHACSDAGGTHLVVSVPRC